jgi:phosphoribosylformylglycinamidine cyclo-ligase
LEYYEKIKMTRAMDESDYQSRESKAVEAIKKEIRSKHNLVPSTKGSFVELYYLDSVFPDYYMSTAIDGVGSKVILAILLNKYDTVGIDCVAMAKNDECAHPGNGNIHTFMYLDYLACQGEIEEKGIAGDIVRGIETGLALADISDITRLPIRPNLGKGETASLDEVIAGPTSGYGFDLAGAMIGFVEKDIAKRAVKTKPKDGDAIIAFRSSGGHSNGYTDFRHYLLDGEFEERPEFRKRYKGRFSINDRMPDSDLSIGKELLMPTRIYAKLMADIAVWDVIGINNTGYGLHNFNRVGNDVKYIINAPMEPQDIFKLMQDESGFNDEKMYRKFNMGMGQVPSPACSVWQQ